ncbi:MAG TPA: hypothetical protein VLA21_07900 [Candidatus Limnocylindria bacterium]|nr:hypothetical protein [Candidatus Limnocylindria bacterium]
MARVNYVRECRAFQRFACGKGLTANEVVLWHALFELFNLEARGGDWPDGFVPLTNARVLSLTTFGSGDSGCETLRRARERLARHGLIRYRRGRRQQTPPAYALVYFHADTGDAPDAHCETHSDAPAPTTSSPRDPRRGNGNPAEEGSRAGEALGKPLGDTMGNPQGSPLDIPINLKGNQDPNPVVHTHPPGERRCGEAAAAPPGDFPDEGGGAFDAAWRTSAKARGAVAQRLIGRYEGLMDARDAWGSLCELMEGGMPPERILREMPTRPTMNRLVARLRALALCGEGTG